VKDQSRKFKDKKFISSHLMNMQKFKVIFYFIFKKLNSSMLQEGFFIYIINFIHDLKDTS
jgi:hypothetical protein